MTKVVKRILLVLLAIIVIAVAAFIGIYFTRILTVSSIEQLTDYEDGYNLYSMDIRYNYSLDDIIDYGITDDQTMIDAILKESLPLIPAKNDSAHRSPGKTCYNSCISISLILVSIVRRITK